MSKYRSTLFRSPRTALATVSTVALGAALLLSTRSPFALSPAAEAVHSAPSHHPGSDSHDPARSGFWHTSGSQILDSQDRPVRISGVNWSGFETAQAVPGGLAAQDYRTILRTIKAKGFNTVRLPFSNQTVESPTLPYTVAFRGRAGAINTDLRGLTTLEILDRVVEAAGALGLKIILDNHRSEAGSSAEENGLWYSTRYPESAWIEDWRRLAIRYRGNATVIGMDLRNEPHSVTRGGACWDCGGPRDWHAAAQRAGNAILAINPDLLIFVEGVDAYDGDFYWWGGNLAGVRRSPVRLVVPNHLVYSAHEYGPAEYRQPWFNSSTSPTSLTSQWRRHWAFIAETGLAPVWIGEFGTPNDPANLKSAVPGSQGQWFQSLVEFLRTHTEIGWSYWGINGEDRYGLLDGTYVEAGTNALKLASLMAIQHPSAEPLLPQGKDGSETEDSPTATPPSQRKEVHSPVLTGSRPPSTYAAPSGNLDSSGSPQAARVPRHRRTAANRSLKPDLRYATVNDAIAANVRGAVENASRQAF